jgi:hypothetical protein
MNKDLQNDLQNTDSRFDLLIKNMAQDHQPQLPSPGVIWWRAQIQKKLAEKERVERPMMIMRVIVLAFSVAFVAGVLLMNWREIGAMTGGQPGPFFVLGIVAAAALVFAGSLLFRESMGKS